MAQVKRTLATLTAFSITTASLADGAGRSTASVDNTTNLYDGAIVTVELTTGGSAHDDGTTVDVYLLFDDNDGSDPIRTDNWAGTDAAFTVQNALLLGAIRVTTATATEFRGRFDTAKVTKALGPKWGIALVNNTGQTLSTTEADGFARYQGYYTDTP